MRISFIQRVLKRKIGEYRDEKGSHKRFRGIEGELGGYTCSIKQLVLEHRVRFTKKADDERDLDDLLVREIYESILNAVRIDKTLSSKSASGEREKLYVIKGLTFDNILIYTKGKIVREDRREYFYILISAKRSG